MSRSILAVAAAYLLGSISPAILLSKALGKDIRQCGSGNAGTTNMLRTYGVKAAAVTLLLDALKGAAATVIGRSAAGELCASVCLVAVIIGHIFPLYFGFKGGKGIATAFGSLLVLSPAIALIELAVAVSIMAATKMVSAGSIAGAALLPFVTWYFKPDFLPFAVGIAVLVIYKHRSNIGRILRHEEAVLDFSKFKK
ncbi:MAG: glycerol-3-phosphate 1-O-acyltransferase PlsY [Firmicutes bacterium]|nr:glycerol-3-phosphate 1-O-acyltransferase PlsY [Bacillota bacterium]